MKMFLLRVLAAGALLLLTTSACCFAEGASDYGNVEFSDLRSIVDRTQSDLRRALELSHGHKQTDRYQKAQDHLSKLDKSLSHGKFNKGAMNDSIDELKSVLDHNTIQASARDALMRDLTDLKVARARR
jgi:hypothetical protein